MTTIRLLGWSAQGFRCPDHKVSLQRSERTPYTVSLLQMPNGTGKTTTLELYMALMRERCLRDGLGIDDEVVATQFRLHLHRGIAYLASDRQAREGISAFMARSIEDRAVTVV